jgi:arabinofuranan 3-O-arabinosyltransferase
VTARRGAARWLGIGLPALLAYVPLLLTQPGQVGADTKTYLYLDPARLLERAPYLWDEHIGAGTITHQNIGYLWPMGPWYWFFDTLGFPDWVAQRLWLATVLFAAALGIRFLLGTLGWHDRSGEPNRSGELGRAAEYGVLVASLAYMLSPYLLDYAARISVILLPWAGLPWMVALTARALRRGGWVDGAWFALVVLTVGGINATALIMVAPAVVLWVVNAVWVEREVTGRAALAAVGRLGALTAATSLWWIAGLWAQGTYGLPILRFTETYKAVADSSTAPEVLRGLGYWFFYGRDKLGPWIEPSVEYTNRTLLLGVSFLLPLLAVVSAAATRWRHRSYFLAVLCVGVLLSVGAHPWSDSSPAGALFKTFTRTDSGLALRSTPRAVPLIVLGTAVLLGAGVRALGVRLAARSRHYPIALAALASLLIVANLPPLWDDTLIARNLRRPEEVPSYWTEAAAWLDGQDREDGGWSTRVLEIPGSDFASYRWGNTVDPITPGLIDRPYLARELFQYGTPASAALLLALDRHLQEDTLDPDALTPVARLLGVGDIVHRGDLQYERYRTARPVVLAERLGHVDGLDDPVAFGPPNPNVAGPEQTLLDETTLALDPSLPDPSPVTAYPVTDPLPIIRARSSDQPLLLDGGPDGIVDAAGAQLLQDDQAIFYAASFADDADELDQLLADGADLLVTDSNRQQGRRWGLIQQNTGYTERPGEKPKANDPSDQRLVVFPDAPDSSFTTSEQRGPVLVTATDYGNPVSYTPDDRPANAVDGDPTTAWRVGAFSDVRGEALRLTFAEPVTTDRLTLLQPITGIVNRSITELDLVFDDGERVPVNLDKTSQELPGQTVTFPRHTFQDLRLEIRQTDVGTRTRYDGLTGVGFAEVSVGDERGARPLGEGPVQEELIHPPSLLLDEVGDRSSDHRLGYLFTRLRANPQEVVRSDEEPWLARAFDVPTRRMFGVGVEARLSGRATDEVIDAILGLPPAEEGGMTVTSGATLAGALTHRASTAFDGDPTTFWMPPFSERAKDYVEFTLPEQTTVDHLDLQVVADGRHSVPETAFIRADGDESTTRAISFGEISDGTEINGTKTVRVTFPAVTGTTFRLAFDANREIPTRDWYSGDLIPLPIGIAEVGVPGHQLDPPAATFDTGCRDDLLTVDGDALPVRVSGRTADALARRELTVEPCSRAGGEVALDAGEHVVRSTPGRVTGIDIDAVALTSDAGGDALAPAAWTDTDPRPTPDVQMTAHGPVDATVTVEGLSSDAWLVLGQSLSSGWSARVDGGPDLGAPTLIDGYANGWRLDADELGSGPLTIHLEWKPQRVIWIAIWLSLIGVLACIAVIVVGALRRRRAPTPATWETLGEDGEPPTLAPFPGDAPTTSWGRALAAGAALGAATVLLAPPPALVALPVMAVTVATLRWRQGVRLAAWCAAAALAFIAAFYLVEQHRLRHPPDFAWPRAFDAVHTLGLLVVFLLLVDLAIAVARSRTPPSGRQEDVAFQVPESD